MHQWNPWTWPTHAPAQPVVRSFAQPRPVNSLPQTVRDQLPPGLRDKPDDHPGLANHLRKMGVLKDYPAVDPVPPTVRNQLPTGLRDLPYDHPGVANYLGKMGWTIDHDGLLSPPPGLTPASALTPALTPAPALAPTAPVPAMQQPFQTLRSFFRR
jgi:hypothetical protein